MKTKLYDRHVQLGAKMIDVHGWEMPLHYSSIHEEYFAVREEVGVFDISHMGVVRLRGRGAEPFVEMLSTNEISDKPTGSVTYTIFVNKEGKCIDDALVYKRSYEELYLIVNTVNREKIVAYMKELRDDLHIELLSDWGVIALQGPKSLMYLKPLHPEVFGMKRFTFLGEEFFISATGYTGEDGYEIFGPYKHVDRFFDYLVKYKVTPCGLGARDLLRLEMGYPLYGHEITEELSPLETIACKSVKMDHDFLGKAKMTQNKQAIALILEEEGVPRRGCSVFHKNRELGIVTSGNFSPILGKGIALAIVEETEVSPLSIEIRGRKVPAKQAKLPFIK